MNYEDLLMKYMQDHSNLITGHDFVTLKQFCLWLNFNAIQGELNTSESLGQESLGANSQREKL